VYVVPINQLSRQTSDSVTLTFDITAVYSDVKLSNITIADAYLEDVELDNCVLESCIVRRSEARKTIFNACALNRTTVGDCLIYGCDLIDITDGGGNSIRDSQYVGGNKQLEDLKDLMFNVLLILLIMIPVTIPTVTASYSFVGEKVNKSLEPLLATPISDLELLAGKSGSIFAVSMGATWLSFLVAVAIVDVLTEPALGYYPLPNTYWVVGMVLLAPAMCLMSILANVIISSKVNDVRVSQQIGGVIILPVLLFFIMSLTGILATGVGSVVLFSAAMILVDAGILLASMKIFRREEILVNWK
jgi:ABC-2 type transport system permease protein